VFGFCSFYKQMNQRVYQKGDGGGIFGKGYLRLNMFHFGDE